MIPDSALLRAHGSLNMSSIWLVYGSRRRTGSNPGRWPCEGLSVFVLVGILDTRVALTPRTSGSRWRDFGRLTLLVYRQT